jgi:hypothetical protein
MASASLNLSVIEKRMMTESEAASYCSLPVKTFKGACPVRLVCLGGRSVYDKRDLDQWIDNVKTGSADTSQSAILGRLE